MQYSRLSFHFTPNILFNVILERTANTKMRGDDRKQGAYNK